MDPAALWPLLLVLVASALFAGVLAGLLGVGGGIVLVPVLDVALRAGGVTADWSMHVAVATSLATIIPTSIASSRAHASRGAIDWSIARAWAPGMLAGALAGSLLAARIVDELHAFIAATLFGPRGRPGAVDWAGPDFVGEAPHLLDPTWETCGRDAYVRGRVAFPPKASLP